MDVRRLPQNEKPPPAKRPRQARERGAGSADRQWPGVYMSKTTIEWTDYTFNPWSGCSKVSPGCANCYAEVNYSVRVRGVKWGPQGNRIVKAESGWKEPI